MNTRRFLAFGLMLALAPSFTLARTSNLQQRIEAERQKSQALQAQLHQKRVELNAAASHENDLQAQLDQIAGNPAHVFPG